MSSDHHPSQDLEAILKTLSAFAPAGTTQSNLNSSGGSHTGATHQLPIAPAEEDEDPYEPPDIITKGHVISRDPQRDVARQQQNPDLRVSSTRPSQPASTAHVDSSRILSWPEGLRQVSRLAGRNEDLGRAVHKMIKNQHENERQWWVSREALIEKQKKRIEDREILQGLLKNLGGLQSKESLPDETTELKQYDMKVHRAQTTMIKAMSEQLKHLGVPFFGTQPSLIKDGHGDSEAGADAQTPRQISQSELLKLQRKMIQHLEDMYSDAPP